MIYLFIILISSVFVHSDESQETCRAKMLGPNHISILSSSLIKMKYAVAVADTHCKINITKEDIRKGQTKAICPNHKTQYKMGCLREWMTLNQINYTAGLAAFHSSAIIIAKEDKNQFPKDHKVLAQMIDLLLLGLEVYSTKGNIAYISSQELKENEQMQNLRLIEQSSFTEYKKTVIDSISKQIVELKKILQTIPPQSADYKWLSSSALILESRLSKIKSH